MRNDVPQTVHLNEYRPTPFVISHVELHVALHPTKTRIESSIDVRRRSVGDDPLEFDGEGLELISVAVDGQQITSPQFSYAGDKLTVWDLPDSPFKLQIVQACNPQSNTVLSGLYLSNHMYCTQMEAQGFRRFAFMYDRPDVMATYRVRITAPQAMPVLLSNGNLTERGESADTHFALWDDPHPKPTYLFALVGGDLASVHDGFTTSEGRKVELGIYVEKGKEDRCAWAMEALKASMLWDEKRFGRAYDLDVFNIVAVSDFNMGAMENKGLNIFNDKYILARPDTATDTDYVNIERIIAHEYFHNWTGNRITCRDWFQLCLKEGLTVYRDQEFTADLRSRAVKRIEDVKTLRSRQFPEDQGPLAHPVRPSSYIEINNFYTPTVYEKGAELCRMLETLIGRDGFRKATDIYFDRHDGDAATVEDFLRCMSDASGRDLGHFAKWYEQAGTPVVRVKTSFDATRQVFAVHVEQTTPPTAGQETKLPLHIPLALGLLDDAGNELPLQLEGVGALNQPLLELKAAQQTYKFTGVAKRPRLSINRGFTAPIILQSDASPEDLLFLIGNDTDGFNRWESAQTYARNLLVRTTQALAAEARLPDCFAFAKAIESSIVDDQADGNLKSLMLALPSEAEIAATIGVDVNSDTVHGARESVRRSIAAVMLPTLEMLYAASESSGAYAPDTTGTGLRAQRYAALSLIAAYDPEQGLQLAKAELKSPSSMTAEIGAISAVINITEIDELLEQFLARHRDDHLLVDKWLTFNAQVGFPGAAQRVEKLLAHELFNFTTPNKVYALLGGLWVNQYGFHAADGEGYRVVADCIIKLNEINPQVAARMATGFRSWKLFDAPRRAHATREMQRILAVNQLSNDVFEIISRTLKA